MISKWLLLGCVSAAWAAGASAQAPSGSTVELQVVKYDGLAREILRNRGKVVVVDFWADY